MGLAERIRKRFKREYRKKQQSSRAMVDYVLGPGAYTTSCVDCTAEVGGHSPRAAYLSALANGWKRVSLKPPRFPYGDQGYACPIHVSRHETLPEFTEDEMSVMDKQC